MPSPSVALALALALAAALVASGDSTMTSQDQHRARPFFLDPPATSEAFDTFTPPPDGDHEAWHRRRMLLSVVAGRGGGDWRRTLRDITGGPEGAEGQPVLVTFASGGYWPMLRGWLAGLLARGVTRFAVIPVDHIAAAALEAVVPGHVLYLDTNPNPKPDADADASHHHADFGSERFHAYVANKAVFMRSLLEEGYHVFFADADVAWRGDPLEAVARLGLAPDARVAKSAKKRTEEKPPGAHTKWRECEVTWQPNKDHDNIAAFLRETERAGTPKARTIALNGAANTGLFLLKPTRAALELMMSWEAALDYETHGNDQPALNSVLMHKWKDLGGKLCTLPPNVFPTGYTLLKSGVPDGAVGVHLNYAVGVRRKAEWAARLGLTTRLDQVPLASLPATSAPIVLAEAREVLARQERAYRLIECQLQERRSVVTAFVRGVSKRFEERQGAHVDEFERRLPLIMKSASHPAPGLALMVGGDEIDQSVSDTRFRASGITVIRLPTSAANGLDTHVRDQCDEHLEGLFCPGASAYLRLNLAGVNVSPEEILRGMKNLLRARFFASIAAVVPVGRLRWYLSGLSGEDKDGHGSPGEEQGYEVFLLGDGGSLYPASRGYWDEAYVSKACGDDEGSKGEGECTVEMVAVPRGTALVRAVLTVPAGGDPEAEPLGACLLSLSENLNGNEGAGAGESSGPFYPPPSGSDIWRAGGIVGVRVETEETGMDGPAVNQGKGVVHGECASVERLRGGPMHPDVCHRVHSDIFTWLAAAHGAASALVIGAHRGGRGAKQESATATAAFVNSATKAKKTRDRDPGWDHLSSPAMSAWRKVFVEPVPQMFKKLEDAVRWVPNATAVNVALARRSGKRWMFCPAMDGDGRLATVGGGARLPQWLDETCSMDPSRFGGSRGVRGGAVRRSGEGVDEDEGSGGIGLGVRATRKLRRSIRKIRVDAVTVEELVRREGLSAAGVQYVQVDAGGLDDVVVRQVLALRDGWDLVHGAEDGTVVTGGTTGGGDGRRGGVPRTSAGPRIHPTPAVIVYDTDLLDADKRRSTLRLLHRHGYSTCLRGENTIAVRMSPPNG